MKRFLLLIAITLLFWASSAHAMICLDNTDTLEGGASVTNVVDYTVHGFTGTTYVNLAQGQLSDTDPSVLYTATSDVSVVSVILVNTHSAAVTVNLYLDPENAGTPRRLIPEDLSLGIGYSLQFDGQRASVMDDSGGLVVSYPSTVIVSGASIADNAVVRGDGGGQGVQTSGVSIDDSNNVSTTGTVSATTAKLSDLTDTYFPYSNSGTLADSPLTTDGTDVTNSGELVQNGVLTVNPDGTNEVFQVDDGSIDLTDGNAGTTGTLSIDSDGDLAYTDELTINDIFTVVPDGTNETFQVNDGTLDFTDGNAGTTGTLTVDASGNWSYNKNIVSTGSLGGTTAKLSDLTDGYLPKHTDDATGLEDSIVSESGSTHTLHGDNAAHIYAPSTAGDTAFWAGAVHDSGGDDDDVYQIGDGSTPGTNPFVTVDSTGNVGIGVNPPSERLDIDGDLLIRDTSDPKIGFGHINPTIFASIYRQSSTGKLFIRNDQGYSIILDNGDVGIGMTSPNQKLTVEGSISLKEQAAAAADTAAYGQIWVKTGTPCTLWFTADDGSEGQISSHPFDAPESLYTYGPGIDWIDKRQNKYLGVIFWQTLDGTITEETFEAYNLRRKDEPGHTNLIKRDWDTVQLAKLRAEKLAEVIEEEVTPVDAFEEVEIMEEVQISTKSAGYEYTVGKDGKVSITEKTDPVMEKRGTGEFKKQPKAGVSFDSETGKFIRKRNRTEAEVDAMNLKAPEMPEWMKTWIANNVVEK